MTIVANFRVSCAMFGLRTATVVAVLLTLGAVSLPAAAQAPAADAACADAKIPDSPMATQLRELGLQPGVKIDPATFMKDPQVAAYVGEVMKHAQTRDRIDPAGLCRYRADNAAQLAQGVPTVIFIGDSITENWGYGDPSLFSDRVIDRGIGGQTSAQILLRFYPDVVALQPHVVQVMAGTNDILHSTGVVRDTDILNNIKAMIDIAQAHHIRLELASIPPISVRAWQPDLKPAARIRQLNQQLQALAAARGVGFVDYYAVLADADGGLRADLGNDGVHPNRDGYAAMRPLALRAIAAKP